MQQTKRLSVEAFTKNLEKLGIQVSGADLSLLEEHGLFEPAFPPQAVLGDGTDVEVEPWYSEFQLLWFARFADERNTLSSILAHLRGDDTNVSIVRLVENFREMNGSCSSFARALECVAIRYISHIRGFVTMSPESRFDNSSLPDAVTTFAVLNCTPQELLDQAKFLLAGADGLDGLGQLYEVLRHASWRAMDTTRGVVRAAHSYRVAAELLLALYDELAEQGECEPLEPPNQEFRTPLHGRLGGSQAMLRRALLESGLSTNATVIVAVEGETEQLMVPRVFEHLGVDLAEAGIRVVNLQGEGNAKPILARFSDALMLGRQFDDFILLTQRGTHLAVLLDADKNFSTQSAVDKLRYDLIAQIRATMPSTTHGPALDLELSHLVSVQTWGNGQSFEWAHFDDDELASALLSMSSSESLLADFAANLRKARRIPTNKSFQDAWTAIGKQGKLKIRKTVLADVLWPSLQSKIDLALANSNTESVPILHAVLHIMAERQAVINARAVRFK